ncbi:8597_t:CDS:2 [Scutellospora calospora]|uniref:8597_t:CDS:1 n=1 Tax=Scutellospora calospora TaxID=85575 RepID=A0ACA9JU07_9GLOM|nr:8597_t:CDS:2 [Scutellospora calospora]
MKIQDEVLFRPEDREYSSETFGITGVRPVFVDHSGLVILILIIVELYSSGTKHALHGKKSCEPPLLSREYMLIPKVSLKDYIMGAIMLRLYFHGTREDDSIVPSFLTIPAVFAFAW